MAILAINRKVLIGLTEYELEMKCRQLERLWTAKGRPPPDKMPLWMLGSQAALQSELTRRGKQLSLF